MSRPLEFEKYIPLKELVDQYFAPADSESREVRHALHCDIVEAVSKACAAHPHWDNLPEETQITIIHRTTTVLASIERILRRRADLTKGAVA